MKNEIEVNDFTLTKVDIAQGVSKKTGNPYRIVHLEGILSDGSYCRFPVREGEGDNEFNPADLIAIAGLVKEKFVKGSLNVSISSGMDGTLRLRAVDFVPNE